MDMAKATSVSKTIEQMVTHSEQPSSGFIVKETKFGSIESSPPLGPFPVIDMSLFSSQEHVGTELEKLKSSLSSAGCFQVLVVGHGMSDSFLDRVREVAVEFFQLPAEEKQKHARAVNEIEGYGSDLVVSDAQVFDWCHRLFLRVFPVHRRRLNLWPQHPPEFSEILNEYAMKLKTVTEVLSKAIAKSLNLEENSFLKQFGDQALMQVRFNFYPPCSRPDLVHGVKPHTDRSGITILLQDREVEGLQIRVDGKWYRVPVIPHALVVNLGDQMQIMTNGIYKSPMHRVVTNTEKLRISIAAFTEPEPENEIGPVDQLIDEQRPKLYRNVRNYGAINYECYQKGLVALDTVRA
ncbi:Fe2OG dioxygenase domain-containing protein [Citrus sinensis]|uniref:Fe2OG dioxygenase domain-containing protein n=1 Tax=Citrus sinensis TaxID=2711 RepID=A0ACB8P5Y1_CITSI|nr:Fe2OG dioxygenase domain-containing protein [Citrus sinensis]